ncbi:unnamed protein product, partial [Rotaria socialis]
MANKLLDLKIATPGPSEEVNIAGSGGKNLKMTMRYVEISIFFKKKLKYNYLIFGIMPDDKMPACVILSFNMMSRYGISLNYDRMTLHSFGDEIQCMGRVGDENFHRVGKVDFNDPLQYLTGGLDIPKLPIDKTITVRQGFQKDFLLSKKLETDDAITQNRAPSLHKQEDIARHEKEYLGLSRCFEIDNGDPDNIVPIVNNLNNQSSLHDVIKKHEPENKFLHSIINNLIGKDEESSLEPVISSNTIDKDAESLIDAKNSLNILVNSIKRAHGIPVEDSNWLNLAKPDTPEVTVSTPEPAIVEEAINVITDVKSQDTVLTDNITTNIINCFYSSNLTNKLKLIDSKKELVLKYSFNVKNNCRNAIKQFEIFTDSVVIIPDAERINLNKNVFNNKDRQIHLSDKIPDLPVIKINPSIPVENKDTSVKTSRLSERISIIESIMNNRGLTYKNRKAEVARILEFDKIDFPREVEVGGFGGIESLIAHQKSDPKLTIIRNMVKTEPVRWDNQIVEYHNIKANIHIVKGALVFYRVKDNKLLPLI